MTREHVLAALYDLALVVGGEMRVRALLSRFVQRLLFHTSFPIGLALRSATRGERGAEATLEAAIGDWRLSREVGKRITVAPALIEGPSAVLPTAGLLDGVIRDAKRYPVAVRLVVPDQGTIVLIGCDAPSPDVPIERVFEPVLANLSRAVILCQSHEAQTRRLESERDDARAALERFRAAVDTSADLIFLVDPDTGSLVDVNGTAESALGLRRDVLSAATLSDVTPGLSVDQLRSVAKALLAGERAPTVAARHTLSDGSTIPVEIRFGASRPSDGAAVLIAESRDIRERLRLEQQFLQAQKLDAIGRLAGGVAHDFNNILTVILGAAWEILDELPPGDPLRAAAIDIDQSAVRAAALTRQLLLVSRKGRFENTRVDVGSLVRSSSAMLQRLVSADIEIASSVRTDGECVLADESRLQQVLLNLVVNARDAMPSGGRITVDAWPAELSPADLVDHPGASPGPYVAMAVSDVGCGMSDDVLSRIFEPFFTTKPEGRGTGLGLSTVYGIVQQLGGHLVVRSSVGQGSRFEVWLPRVAGAASDATGSTSQGAVRGHGECVLVVDDEPLVRAFAERTLRRAGYRVLVAADGREATDIASEQPIDLVLTDVVMPHMRGEEVVARIRARHPEVRVIFQSGYYEQSSGEAAIEEHHLLVKPYNTDKLCRAVHEALSKRRDA